MRKTIILVEQNAMSDLLVFELDMHDQPNRDLIRTRNPAFECPSATNLPEDGVNADALRYAPTSYVGCAGAFRSSFHHTAGEPRRDGMFQRDSKLKFRDVTDGTSNTFLLGETIHYRGIKTRANGTPMPATWDPNLYGRERNGSRDAHATLHATRLGFRKINPPLALNQTNLREAFASYHPGGAQFAMTDGSVRFVSETIEHNQTTRQQYTAGQALATFQRLAKRNDGLPVGDF